MIERKQDVVDRRAIGHDGTRSGQEQRAAVFPRNQRSLNSPMAVLSRAGAETGLFPVESCPGAFWEWCMIKGRNSGFDRARNSGSSLLKWLNSLYRPAVPQQDRRKLTSRAF